MSKKMQAPERPITDRIAKARREGRTQQALELTRTLVKYEPTEANRELLRQVTLERGQQLHSNGLLRDAATVFSNALNMGGSPEFQAQVAQRLAACGAVTPALQAAQQVADPAARQKILQSAVDAAVAQGPSGKATLPADLHAAFDATLLAFAHYEAGRDEDARAAMQSIGLTSPLLEWKVLLRGLLAYVANDDARALENWQRLDPARLPSRLCATLRASIDAKYLASQPAAVQQTLRSRMMQQQGLVVAPALRELKPLLNDVENLGPAFRKAEPVAAYLRREHPHLLPRFAQCFAWALIDHGEPEDINRYQRTFGVPADDPHLYRLEALALEARGMWPEAHKAWQDYLNDIASAAAAWPGDSGARAQALVWTRLAMNAGPQRRRSSSGNPLFDLFAAHTGPLKPGPEQCLEKAIKLAPDRLEPYRALFELYRSGQKISKAKKIGQELLKRFPDHADTMEALGELCMDSREYKKAQDYYEKAMHANPLNAELRAMLARVRRNYALTLTLAGKHEQARAQYQQTLPLVERSKASLLCQWAVAELKAKDPVRAEQLIAEAHAQADHRLAIRHALVGESIRAKLPPKDKKHLADDFKAALAEAPTPAEILVLVEGAAQQRAIHDDAFHGQKTQEKTIVKFLDHVEFNAFDEGQLQRLCGGLMLLSARKPWFACLNHARRRFPKSAFFRLSFVDYYMLEQTRDAKTHLAREHLDAARRLIEDMPRGEVQQKLLEGIQDRQEMLAELDARNASMRGGFFGGFGDPFDDDDYDDDFADDGWW